METPNAKIKGRDRKKDGGALIFLGKFIWTNANLFLHEATLTAGQSRMVFMQGAERRHTL